MGFILKVVRQQEIRTKMRTSGDGIEWWSWRRERTSKGRSLAGEEEEREAEVVKVDGGGTSETEVEDTSRRIDPVLAPYSVLDHGGSH